jgi:hypothetical protein
MIYILILYGLISLISYVATAAIMGKFKKGGDENEKQDVQAKSMRHGAGGI